MSINGVVGLVLSSCCLFVYLFVAVFALYAAVVGLLV